MPSESVQYGGGRTGPSIYDLYVTAQTESGGVVLSRDEWLLSEAKAFWLPVGGEEWAVDFAYSARMATYHGGSLWYAVTASTGVEPGSSPTIWSRIAEGIDMTIYTALLAAVEAERVAAQTARDAAEVAQAAAEVARANAQSSSRVATTWAALLAMAGTVDGESAEVVAVGTTTHAAASATGYNGSLVTDRGRYAWSAAWGRWVRVGSILLDDKAPTASPTFTGVPTVPTAALGTATTQAANTAFVSGEVAAFQAQLDAVESGYIPQGAWDASVGTFPAAALKSYSYLVSVGGTVDGVEFVAGDRLFALKDAPSTTVYATNWLHMDSRIGVPQQYFQVRNDGHYGNGRQYLFMDPAEYFTHNAGTLAYANSFHYFTEGECRVEFESNGVGSTMQFYIEAGDGYDAWYGLQEGGTHHWSFGTDVSDLGTFKFATGFGINEKITMFDLRKNGVVDIAKDPSQKMLIGKPWASAGSNKVQIYTPNALNAAVVIEADHANGQGIISKVGAGVAGAGEFHVDFRSAANVKLASIAADGRFIAAPGLSYRPGFAFFGDIDTGMGNPSNNNIGLSTGGVERWRVGPAGGMYAGEAITDTSGGISPGNGNASYGVHIDPLGIAYLSRNGSNALRVNRNVDDGKAVIFARQGVESGSISVNALTAFFSTVDGSGLYSTADNNVSLRTDEGERIRIGPLGTTYFGNAITGTSGGALPGNENTESGVAVDPLGVVYASRNGSNALRINRNGTDGPLLFCAKDGAAIGSLSALAGDLSLVSTSDYRAKENIVPIADVIERFRKLKVYNYNKIGYTEVLDGCLAHEFAEAIPHAVQGEKDAVEEDGTTPIYQGVDYAKSVPLLIATLGRALDRIEALEAATA